MYEHNAERAEADASAAARSRFAALPKRTESGASAGPVGAAAAGETRPGAPAGAAAGPPGASAGPGTPATGDAGAGAGAEVAAVAPRRTGFIDPLTKSADRIPVTLEACLRRALANNPGLQVARFGPAIARTVVAEAEAMFDPSWFMNNAVNRVKRDSGSFLTGATTLLARQWDFATGVDSLLPTGGSVAFGQDWTYVDTTSRFFDPNPQYDAALALSVRQPILRGAGLEVTRSPIVLARMDHRASLAQFRADLMNTLLEVERVYWEMVVAETRVEAVGEAAGAARENLRIARRRFEEGKDPRVIVSLAESAAASREADLVVARLGLARTSDALKRLLGDPDLPLEDPIVLQATELPIVEPIPVSRTMLQQSILAAMKWRPEMDQAETRLAQAGVRQRVARNQRLPQLDLSASYAVTGLDMYLDRALDEGYSHRFYDWGAGLELRVPLGNRARAAAHERSRLEQARALHEREDTRQRILLEVSEAVRNLAGAEEAVLATRAARHAAEQALRDQQANVSAGAALVKDLLDAQRDLADAKVREMEAMAGYMTGLASLERAKGSLLDYNGIQLMDDEAGPAPPPPPAAGTP